MGRTRSITNEQILDAAREVFMEKGVRATTLEIAQRAGVSEGTVFKRFDTKDALFFECMETPFLAPWATLTQALTSAQEPTSDMAAELEQICESMLTFFLLLQPMIHMRMSRGADAGPFVKDRNAPPIQGISALTMYLHQQQRHGLLGPVDPEIAARMLIGSVFFYAFGEHAGVNNIMPMPRSTFIRGLIHNLLRGVVVDPSE